MIEQKNIAKLTPLVALWLPFGCHLVAIWLPLVGGLRIRDAIRRAHITLADERDIREIA